MSFRLAARRREESQLEGMWCASEWGSRNLDSQNKVLVIYFINIEQLLDQPIMVKIIEQYALGEQVYSGKFSTVYKGTHITTGELVAIKVIPLAKFKDNPKLETFSFSEISTLSKLKQTKHIVRLIQVLKTVNNFYFVYEYCEGGTLEKLLDRGPLTQVLALNYFSQILEAFKVLTRIKVMHRDLKPSNIFFKDGLLKLGDFGFCKIYEDQQDINKTMVGSPIYMAPQVIKGEPYSNKADIWSLGVVLYEMLFAKCPFEEVNVPQLINTLNRLDLFFPYPNSLNPKTFELINRMLTKDQFKRCDWNYLFLTDLNQSLTPVSLSPLHKVCHADSILLLEVMQKVVMQTQNPGLACMRLLNNLLFLNARSIQQAPVYCQSVLKQQGQELVKAGGKIQDGSFEWLQGFLNETISKEMQEQLRDLLRRRVTPKLQVISPL